MVTTDDWRLKESESSEEEAENLERKGKPHSYARRLVKGDTYGTLLILIIITYALMAALDHSLWFRTVTGACFGLTLVLALHTSKIRNKVYRYGAIAVVVASVVINASAAIRGKEYFFGASYVITILIIAAPFVILVHILRHPIINLETVIGAIDAYMLIAIAFAAVYAAMDRLLESNFFVQGPQQPMHFLYFSFVTITTLGFGDLTPATDPGRVLVSLEAVLGQIFLVTIVALLVSNLGKEKRRVPMHLDDMQDMGGTVED
ncbi:MAG: two pore domain potassium channel family protein [Acidimicrobiia bacterium]|nr:two pore domain potassium channel family protein [Acidimicrobiia bacterium]